MSQIVRILFENEEDWLRARVQDVTSTQVSALPCFDRSPYLSPLELWTEKKEAQVVQFEPTARMKWGTRLQDAIAKGVAEDHGLEVRRLRVYMRRPAWRVGSSFDWEVINHPDGPGIAEIKNVDSLVFRRNWIVNEDGSVEAPPHIELQLQHELLVSGRGWGCIVVLVGGNEAFILKRKADPEIHRMILAGVKHFWASIEANEPPAPDYTRDADLICKLYSRTNEGEVLDATDRADIAVLVAEYQAAQEAEKKSGDARAAAKAKLLERIGTAERVLGVGWTISAGCTKDSPGTMITPEMVGTYYGARKGFRNLRVTVKKGEAA